MSLGLLMALQNEHYFTPVETDANAMSFVWFIAGALREKRFSFSLSSAMETRTPIPVNPY